MHAGRESEELLEIPSVQREIVHLGGLDQCGDRGRGCIHLRGLRFHRHGLLGLSDRQREIDDRFTADGKRDAAVHYGLKAGLRRLHFVIADQQLTDPIAPLRIGGGGLDDAGCRRFSRPLSRRQLRRPKRR